WVFSAEYLVSDDDRGRLHEVQPRVHAGEPEDAPHGLSALNDRQLPAAVQSASVGAEDQAQPRGVHEPERAQVEHEQRRRALVLDPAQLLLESERTREVELAA